jgi:hypothetical protein
MEKLHDESSVSVSAVLVDVNLSRFATTAGAGDWVQFLGCSAILYASVRYSPSPVRPRAPALIRIRKPGTAALRTAALLQ